MKSSEKQASSTSVLALQRTARWIQQTLHQRTWGKLSVFSVLLTRTPFRDPLFKPRCIFVLWVTLAISKDCGRAVIDFWSLGRLIGAAFLLIAGSPPPTSVWTRTILRQRRGSPTSKAKTTHKGISSLTWVPFLALFFWLKEWLGVVLWNFGNEALEYLLIKLPVSYS